jgi:DNA-binding CsgD family transcriptional regulator
MNKPAHRVLPVGTGAWDCTGRCERSPTSGQWAPVLALGVETAERQQRNDSRRRVSEDHRAIVGFGGDAKGKQGLETTYIDEPEAGHVDHDAPGFDATSRVGHRASGCDVELAGQRQDRGFAVDGDVDHQPNRAPVIAELAVRRDGECTAPAVRADCRCHRSHPRKLTPIKSEGRIAATPKSAHPPKGLLRTSYVVPHRAALSHVMPPTRPSPGTDPRHREGARVAVLGQDRLLRASTAAALAAVAELRGRVELGSAVAADVVVLLLRGVADADAVADARRRHVAARLVIVGGDRELHRGIRADDVVLPAQATFSNLVAAVADLVGRQPAPTRSPLSDRQLEILALLVNGHRPNEIAVVLGITMNTYRTHLRRARETLACTSTLQVISEGMRRGWIDPPHGG